MLHWALLAASLACPPGDCASDEDTGGDAVAPAAAAEAAKLNEGPERQRRWPPMTIIGASRKPHDRSCLAFKPELVPAKVGVVGPEGKV